MLVAATLTWGQAEAREMATLTVSAPPGAAAALQPVVNAFRREGGGPVSIVIENEASGSSDVVLATEDVMRGLEQRQWIDPLFVTSFIYGSGKQQHFCGVAAADHSLHKLEAGLFLRFLEAQAPGRIDRFLGGPLGDRSVC
ncbi:hypothetical protein [Sphingobium subterraneum]|uniref:Uncharacterized protein n=1 Tax=Sphingobium subterraneum TaxID=627688 RepID=A0A841J918_9SPHN|nr:hypothetical protein [Sphingobium subterraneum]MBB6125038.1 hypothetical protein [Sphingobium subterraneum]